MSCFALQAVSLIVTVLVSLLLPLAMGAAGGRVQARSGNEGGSGLCLGMLVSPEDGKPRLSWELKLSARGEGGHQVSLQVGGAPAGGVPVGRQAEGDAAVSYGGVRWEGADRWWAQLEASRGRRYAGFAGPLRLVDGTVVEEATRAWAAALALGLFEARALVVRQAPLWYTHARRVAGDAWAVELRLPGSEAQMVVADTGLQRLDFATRSPTDVRRVEAAALAGLRLKPASGLELLARGGVSRRLERDGPALSLDEGWAALVRLRKTTLRPGWRLEVRAISPSFDSPLWGEEAPTRGVATLAGRWAWARGDGPAGGWVEGEATQYLATGRPGGRVEAACSLRAGTGALTVGVTARSTSTGAALESGFSVGYEGGTGGLRFEVVPEGGAQWAGRVRPGGGWQLRAAWRPQPEIVRVEVEWAPGRSGSGPGGWPYRGLRLAAKWADAHPQPYLFAEAGWAVGERLALGMRLGRWDEGRLDLFFDPRVSLLVMAAWQFA